MPRGEVAVKIGAWVDVTRGTCRVAPVLRDVSFGIQVNKKCPGGAAHVGNGKTSDRFK